MTAKPSDSAVRRCAADLTILDDSATNTGSQIGAEKTAVGRFVCESAHGDKMQIDGAGGELTGFDESDNARPRSC